MYTNDFQGEPYSHNNQKHVDKDKVEDYTLEDYGFTVDNLKMNHFGIDVKDPRTGEELPEAFYRSKIESAVAQVEKALDIVILPRVVSEHHDLYGNDFSNNMFMHVFQRPILQVENVKMEYGDYRVFNYPSRWWKVYNIPGHIEMLPSLLLSGENMNLSQAYVGHPAMAGMPPVTSHQSAPQLFHVDYVAGMLPPQRRGVSNPYEMHPDLWQVVIKMALKEIFEQWGRLIIGAGIADMSISVDGVSQSIGTTQSARYSGASAEIVQLDDDINNHLARLKSYYGLHVGIV